MIPFCLLSVWYEARRNAIVPVPDICFIISHTCTHMHTRTHAHIHMHTHCTKRLVVLTGEWLPWLHGLLCTIGQLYKTTSFLVVSSSFLCSEMRKSGGNNEETTSLVVLYNYQTKT